MSLCPYTGFAGIFCAPHWLSAYPTKLDTPVGYKTMKHLSNLPSADVHCLHPIPTICVLVIFHFTHAAKNAVNIAFKCLVNLFHTGNVCRFALTQVLLESFVHLTGCRHILLQSLEYLCTIKLLNTSQPYLRLTYIVFTLARPSVC